MTKKRKKRSPQQEAHIAEEVSKAMLRRQIARLKQLPDDFRDSYDTGKDWFDFMKLLPAAKVKEMLAWAAGPVLCLRPLNAGETRVWDEKRKVVLVGLHQPSLTTLLELIRRNDSQCSFIYLPMHEGRIIDALNTLLSEWQFNIRARGQILGSDGYPVGITH